MKQMAKLICQSCGDALNHDADFGTENDGTKSIKYCFRCYRDGDFTEPGLTAYDMQEKVAASLHIPPFLGRHLAKHVPQLERWQASQLKKVA